MPNLPKNIYRTSHGYRVSIQHQHKLYVKYFSRRKYRILSSALSAAKQYLAGLRQNLTTTKENNV